MPNRPHFNDLNRRYREADWVSEFQRLWAIFNHWYKTHVGNDQDRACIEAIKTAPELVQWVDDIVSTSAGTRPDRLVDGYAGSFPRFASNNVLSHMFRAAGESPVIEPRINFP